ncbi:MAG TPA: hypothetical protein VGR95_10085 [Thermoanaerobaculia bacterium]|nr:hypothetical protein [Thermoanaerobaculia bacterium]
MLDIEHELTDPELMSERVAFHARLMAEEQAAAAICDRVLQGPSRWWGNALDQVEGVHTAGMVAVLISRAEDVVPKRPAEALDLVDLALRVAEGIAEDAYPYEHLLKIRGQAMRERSFVLSYMGRFREAAATAEFARVLLVQIPLPLLELARLDLVKSNIARNMEKYAEAAELARNAGKTFLEFGSRVSWLKALQFEAAALFSQGGFAEAREVWRVCEAYAELIDPADHAVLLYNLGMCASELGDGDEAAHYLSPAAAAFEKLGHRVPGAKCRYLAGRSLMAAGAYGEAIETLQRSWHELEELEAIGDAVLPALLLVEAFLIVGRTQEVPAICRLLIDRCTRGGMPTSAMTALAFLRETVATGHASPAMVRQIHDFLRDSADMRRAARLAP